MRPLQLCAPLLGLAVLLNVALQLFFNSDCATGEPDEEAWDYEPRIWSPDIKEEEGGGEIEREEVLEQQAGAPLQWKARVSQTDWSEKEIRSRSHFWPQEGELVGLEREFERRASKKRRKWARQQAQEQPEEKCTQFRVDIRETVICDKRRCDKFDFEWPNYDNQIVHIESTKHGMRFHRAEYAFATKSRRSGHGPMEGRARESMKQVQSVGSREQVVANNRLKPVKFDLFELFKPKTTTMTSSGAPTTRLSSSTVSPVVSPLPSTSAPATSSTSPQTTTTASPQGNTTTIVAPTSDEHEEAQDNNSTRLVTSFRLDTRRKMQTMLGFGGALSDSTCRNIKSLSPDMSKSLMEDYYGQRGVRYNMARMSIGSSDFSTTPYTNNDVQAADDDLQPTKRRIEARNGTLEARMFDSRNDDLEMKRFRLVDEDFEFKMPVARQAIATSRQEIRFFSSLWSPPIWMKNNSHIVHGWLKGDVYGPYYKALADYIVKWLEAYRKNGIEFWGTTSLNEPITGSKPFISHNSLGITREDYVTFIKIHLGPMLRQRGFKDLKLIILDDNKGYAPQLARSVLEDQEASKYVAGVGVHWYMHDEYDNLNFLANEFPDKFVLSTEACNGYLPFQVHTLPGDWDRGVAYMYDIIKLVQKNAVGWVDWNMVLDIGGGPTWAGNNLDAPIIVNAQRDEYYKSPAFYAIGHFSKFVEPNSTRLDHRLANARYNRPLEAVAFYTPKEYVVIVVLNTNKHPVPFRVIVDRQLVRIVTLREESFNTIIFKWKSKN